MAASAVKDHIILLSHHATQSPCLHISKPSIGLVQLSENSLIGPQSDLTAAFHKTIQQGWPACTGDWADAYWLPAAGLCPSAGQAEGNSLIFTAASTSCLFGLLFYQHLFPLTTQ